MDCIDLLSPLGRIVINIVSQLTQNRNDISRLIILNKIRFIEFPYAAIIFQATYLNIITLTFFLVTLTLAFIYE